jgi:hypothetical protein
LYCNEWKEDVIAHVEKICANLLKTLPHTPLGDFGVNFLFIDEDPEQEVFDLLESADNINAHGEVIAKELSAFLKIDDKIMLRFLRRLADGHVVFDFNYNFNIVSKEDFAALNQKLVNRLFTKSENLIRDLYGISGYQVVQHKFTGNTEEKIKSDD